MESRPIVPDCASKSSTRPQHCATSLTRSVKTSDGCRSEIIARRAKSSQRARNMETVYHGTSEQKSNLSASAGSRLSARSAARRSRVRSISSHSHASGKSESDDLCVFDDEHVVESSSPLDPPGTRASTDHSITHSAAMLTRRCY